MKWNSSSLGYLKLTPATGGVLRLVDWSALSHKKKKVDGHTFEPFDDLKAITFKEIMAPSFPLLIKIKNEIERATTVKSKFSFLFTFQSASLNRV